MANGEGTRRTSRRLGGIARTASDGCASHCSKLRICAEGILPGPVVRRQRSAESRRAAARPMSDATFAALRGEESRWERLCERRPKREARRGPSLTTRPSIRFDKRISVILVDDTLVASHRLAAAQARSSRC